MERKSSVFAKNECGINKVDQNYAYVAERDCARDVLQLTHIFQDIFWHVSLEEK